MTRTMYDALEASGIPSGANIACWYPYDIRSDGAPKDALITLTIDNVGTHPDCNILDIESGAASPSDGPGWVDSNTTPFPTLYCNMSTAPDVMSAMKGVTKTWYLWVASLTSSPPVSPPSVAGANVVAQQYAFDGAYDLSVVFDDNWYPDPGDEMAVQVQDGWLWCNKCASLFFPTSGTTGGVCAAGGSHSGSDSYDSYAMLYT